MMMSLFVCLVDAWTPGSVCDALMTALQLENSPCVLPGHEKEKLQPPRTDTLQDAFTPDGSMPCRKDPQSVGLARPTLALGDDSTHLSILEDTR